MNRLVHSSNRIHWVAFIVAAVFALSLASSAHAASASSAPSTAGVIVPLYTYPGSTWATLIQVKEANPGVSIVAVVNPDNGPGASQDPNYLSGIQALRSAGIIVLGYVHTSYAARPISVVEADINSYKGWYNVSGIFLDEMSNVAGNQGYYSSLNTYIKSLGYTMTVGNPGADTIPSYIGTVDVIVVYENSGVPAPSDLGGWHSSYAKSNFASISYGVGSINQTYIASISNSVGYVYLTSGTLPNPYDLLPSYLGSLVAALSGQATSSNEPETSTTSSMITASSTSSSTTASNSSSTTSIVNSSQMSYDTTVTQSSTTPTSTASAPSAPVAVASNTASSSTTSTTSSATTSIASWTPIATAISYPLESSPASGTSGSSNTSHSIVSGIQGLLNYLDHELINGLQALLHVLETPALRYAPNTIRI